MQVNLDITTELKVFILLLMLLASTASRAQVAQNIIDVMKKCESVMDRPEGVEITMDMRTRVLLFNVKGSMVSCTKGKKWLMKTNLKVLKATMRTVDGSDGKQQWSYKTEYGAKKKESNRDTLHIHPATAKAKSETALTFDLYNHYNKAKMKENDKFYEIEFSNPKEDDSPKKTLIRIVKDTYRFHQMEMKQSGATIKLTATKIKYGVDDQVFQLNPDDFPKTVIDRK